MHPRVLIGLTIALTLGLSPREGPARTVLPAGIPDLLDPAVQAHFVPLSVARLDNDPDFPALFLGNTSEEVPQFVLLILDARNGKDTWSLHEDAAIFLLLLSDAQTIQQGYLDEGFAAHGTPSGTFIAAGPEAVHHLWEKLRQSHERLKGLRAA